MGIRKRKWWVDGREGNNPQRHHNVHYILQTQQAVPIYKHLSKNNKKLQETENYSPKVTIAKNETG